MSIKTVLFDLDGTLLNTLTDIADSVNGLLESRGYPVRSLEHIRKHIGVGAEYLVRNALPEGVEYIDDHFREYLAFYKKNMNNHTAPYDGIYEMLASLKERGVKMAVISNKPDHAVVELCEQLFSDYVDFAIGDRPDVENKPSPQSIFKALNALGADKETAVYVGDSGVDMVTAKNAGMPSVGVTWGFRDREDLESNGASHIIDEPRALIDIVDAKNKAVTV